MPKRRLVVAVVAALFAGAASGPAGLGKAAADDPSVPGTGTASAYALNAGIQLGGAGLGLATFLTAFAKYADTTAHGEAEALDPGILALVASLQECNSYALPPSSLPHPIVADTNDSAGKPLAQTQSGAGNATDGAGMVSVSARPNAQGSAQAVGGTGSFPGLFQMRSAAVHTDATWDPVHLVRTVTAESNVGNLALLGNLVALDNLHWTARQVVSGLDSRTSKASEPVSSFSLGSAKLAGVPLPTATPQQAAAAINTINSVTGALGLTIQLPQIVHNASGIEVTSLTAKITGNSVLKALLGPLYTARDSKGNPLLTDIENLLKPSVFDPTNCGELFGLLKSQPPLNAGWNQLGAGYPIVVGAVLATLAGAGSVNLNVGEARVSVDDTYYPPINFGGLSSAATNLAATAGTPGVAGTAGVAASAGRPVAASATAGRQLASPPPGRLFQRATTHRCVTTSPFGHPMCWSGHGSVAAVAVLALSFGLLGGDEILRRRRIKSTSGS